MTVETSNDVKTQELILPIADCYQINPGKDVPDHCQLMHLSQPTMLENTRQRFELDKIYTCVGDILDSSKALVRTICEPPAEGGQKKGGQKKSSFGSVGAKFVKSLKAGGTEALLLAAQVCNRNPNTACRPARAALVNRSIT